MIGWAVLFCFIMLNGHCHGKPDEKSLSTSMQNRTIARKRDNHVSYVHALKGGLDREPTAIEILYYYIL